MYLVAEAIYTTQILTGGVSCLKLNKQVTFDPKQDAYKQDIEQVSEVTE